METRRWEKTMTSKLVLTAVLAAMLGAGAAQAAPSAAVAAALADKGRPEADTKRDGDRKPADMLEFAGVKPGQTIVDLIPGGGYFTRLFSKAVGPTGTVYAVGGPPRPSADPAKPAPTPAQDLIAADPAYANVKSIHADLMAYSIPTKADLVWTAQNYHDIKNVKDGSILAFNKTVYESLKPGGLYVVLDHAAAPGASVTSTLHRIDPAAVKQEVEAAGFKYEGESKVLAHPADDHTKAVFDPSLRGHTDQFVLKFRKPQ
jgi:predicted methyltransferase